eukprot:SAG11_NODE_3588_length_2351_cov_1.313499_2_plen_162_part_00
MLPLGVVVATNDKVFGWPTETGFGTSAVLCGELGSASGGHAGATPAFALPSSPPLCTSGFDIGRNTTGTCAELLLWSTIFIVLAASVGDNVSNAAQSTETSSQPFLTPRRPPCPPSLMLPIVGTLAVLLKTNPSPGSASNILVIVNCDSELVLGRLSADSF